MTIHSSILAWEFPWTEEPGRVESIGRKESDTVYRLNNHKAETINIVDYFLQDCLRKNV